MGAAANCLWVTIDRDKPTVRIQSLDNGVTVPPASERSVDVTAVCFYPQSGQDRPQQHRHMRVAAHEINRNLERNGLEIGRQLAVVFLAEPCIAFFVPG